MGDAKAPVALFESELMALITHELRTPLTPVLAVVSTLEREERLPADVRGALAMIRRNVELEAHLIDNLHDLTRVANGTLELERVPIDVAELLRDLLAARWNAELAAKDIQLVNDLAAPDHRVLADRGRLRQILENLLSNAAQFTPRGGMVVIASRGEDQDDDGARLVLEVRDTGRGVERRHLSRIFDPLGQAAPPPGRRRSGLGLGLSIARGLAELHGGTLEAASPGAGKGATFTLSLPLARAAAAPSPARAPRRADAGGPRALHVLLVEDHADSAQALADLLQVRGGHRVTVAENVSTALDTIAGAARGGEPIELLISDLELPDGSGLDLMRTVAQRTPVAGIALSGYGTEQDVRRSREAGFATHLTKPIDFEELDAAIREVAR